MELLEFERAELKEALAMKALHSHPYYEIYFLAEGTRYFFLKNSMYKIPPMTVIVIPPHVMHMTQGGPYLRYNVYVSAKMLDEYSERLLSRLSLKTLRVDESNRVLLFKLFEKAEQFNKEPNLQIRSQALSGMLSAYLFFISELEPNENMDGEDKFSKSDYIPEQYLKIVEYLSDNCKEKISLEDLSGRFFIAKTTLIHNFKRYFSSSPMELLLNLRLAKAERYLVDNLYTVEQISEICGFSSANYFGLIFKKKKGISPLNYRKKYSDKNELDL